MQFPGLDYGRPPDVPIDPTKLKFRGQPGFWCNSNVTFMVTNEQGVTYAIGALDFEWPKYTNSESLSSDQSLTIGPMVMDVVVEIKKPSGNFITNGCYHFDYQVVTPSSPGAYDLDQSGIEGATTPDFPAITYAWTLDAAAGTLQNATSRTPAHTSPPTPGEGTLALQTSIGGVTTGVRVEQQVRVFQDHLERDIQNFDNETSGTFGGFYIPSTSGVHISWSCYQSVGHAYDGLVEDRIGEWFPGEGFVQQGDVIYITNGLGDWSLPSGTTLQRHDIVAYYGTFGDPGSTDIRHSQIMLDTAHAWAANNNPQGRFVVGELFDYSTSLFVKPRYIEIWRK